MTTTPKALFVRPSNCNVFGLNLYEIVYPPPLPTSRRFDPVMPRGYLMQKKNCCGV